MKIDPLLNDFGRWVGPVNRDPQREEITLTVSEIQSLMWQACRWGYVTGYWDACGPPNVMKRPRILDLSPGKPRADVPWATEPLAKPKAKHGRKTKKSARNS